HVLLNKLGPDMQQERRSLQVFGELLDKRTKGTWVRAGMQRVIRYSPDAALFVLDSVRIPQQVEAIRSSYGRKVVHVHLTADLSVLRGRYRQRVTGRLQELSSYAAVRKNPTERRVDELAPIADVLIRTDRSTPEYVLVV